jgi:hypothetical protein
MERLSSHTSRTIEDLSFEGGTRDARERDPLKVDRLIAEATTPDEFANLETRSGKSAGGLCGGGQGG